MPAASAASTSASAICAATSSGPPSVGVGRRASPITSPFGGHDRRLDLRPAEVDAAARGGLAAAGTGIGGESIRGAWSGGARGRQNWLSSASEWAMIAASDHQQHRGDQDQRDDELDLRRRARGALLDPPAGVAAQRRRLQVKLLGERRAVGPRALERRRQGADLRPARRARAAARSRSRRRSALDLGDGAAELGRQRTAGAGRDLAEAPSPGCAPRRRRPRACRARRAARRRTAAAAPRGPLEQRVGGEEAGGDQQPGDREPEARRDRRRRDQRRQRAERRRRRASPRSRPPGRAARRAPRARAAGAAAGARAASASDPARPPETIASARRARRAEPTLERARELPERREASSTALAASSRRHASATLLSRLIAAKPASCRPGGRREQRRRRRARRAGRRRTPARAARRAAPRRPASRPRAAR